MFLKISWGSATLLRRNSNVGVSCETWEIESTFLQNTSGGCFWNHCFFFTLKYTCVSKRRDEKTEKLRIASGLFLAFAYLRNFSSYFFVLFYRSHKQYSLSIVLPWIQAAKWRLRNRCNCNLCQHWSSEKCQLLRNFIRSDMTIIWYLWRFLYLLYK